MASQDHGWCLHLALADDGLRNSMHGRTMDQLRVWFPETGYPKPGSWKYEWLHGRTDKPGITYKTVGESGFAVQLNDGKFQTIIPMKD